MFCSPLPIRSHKSDGEYDYDDGFVFPLPPNTPNKDHEALMQGFLQDLTFWEVEDPSSSVASTTKKTTSSPRKSRSRRRRRSSQTTSRRSSSSPEQQQQEDDDSQDDNMRFYPISRSRASSCSSSQAQTPQQPVWRTAVDPQSGQTYYYDAITRKTQWEKPAEIKAYERAKRKQKRKQDRLFFNEMERNIYDAIARGEYIPGTDVGVTATTAPSVQDIEQDLASETHMMATNENSPMEDNSNDDSAATRKEQQQQQPRVRTISGMDDWLVAELAKHPTEQHRFIASRPPQNERSTASSSSSSEAAVPHAPGRPPRPAPRRSNSPPKRENSMELSPDYSDSHAPLSPKLAGEHLLDGPIQEDVRLEEDVVSPNSDNIPKPAHVRRNTGGTIFVKSTMTNPNVDATVKCVCGVFRAHILQARDNRANNSPVSVSSHYVEEVMRVFNDPIPKNGKPATGVPSLAEITAFYQDFYKRSQMEHDTIIMSLIYVERLIKETNGDISPVPQNWMSILFSSMVLASKVWDDLSMWNIDFSNVCGRTHGKASCFSSFTLHRINKLELALLKSLNFNVKVPASEYAKYYFLIRSMLIKSGLLDEGGGSGSGEMRNNTNKPLKPLDMQGAKNLETLSSNYQDAAKSWSQKSNDKNNRRSMSMDGYFWGFLPHNNNGGNQVATESRQPQPTGDSVSTNNASASGPVLKQSVCLEQLVERWG